MLSEFLNSEVDFLLVGAYALAAHGYPRSTGDMGLWVRADESTGPRVYEALQRFGAPLHNLDISDLCRPGIVFQMGLPPVRIDILTNLSGLLFEHAWVNRVKVKWDGLEIPVIGRNDLILNKRSTGRIKDLADAEQLDQDEIA